MNFKKRDFIFILIIPVLCLILFTLNNIFSVEGNTVYIYYNSTLYKSVSLDEDTEISINGTNTVTIKDGYAYMSHATCPDKLCIKQGKIDSSAKDIVCLPNKVRITVNKKTKIDAISQ